MTPNKTVMVWRGASNLIRTAIKRHNILQKENPFSEEAREHQMIQMKDPLYGAAHIIETDEGSTDASDAISLMTDVVFGDGASYDNHSGGWAYILRALSMRLELDALAVVHESRRVPVETESVNPYLRDLERLSRGNCAFCNEPHGKKHRRECLAERCGVCSEWKILCHCDDNEIIALYTDLRKRSINIGILPLTPPEKPKPFNPDEDEILFS